MSLRSEMGWHDMGIEPRTKLSGPARRAQAAYWAISHLGDWADSVTRIPRYGYHLAGPVHRLAVALMPIYRRSLRAAADDAARKLETCPAPRWADGEEMP